MQIKFNSMVNYEWELKYYRGCLIAVSSKCIAYALKGTYSIIIPILIVGFIHCIEVSVYFYLWCLQTFLTGRQGYVVRLLNPETASRTLIKGFVGTISELAFSHRDSDTLACVDEGGNVYIWVIHEENGKLEYPVDDVLFTSNSYFSKNIIVN